MTLQELLAMPLLSWSEDGKIFRVPNGWIFKISIFTAKNGYHNGEPTIQSVENFTTTFVPEPEIMQEIDVKMERTFTLPEMKEAYATGYKQGIDSPAAFLRPDQLNKRMKYDFKQHFNVELP